jgi:hypothetical protein
MPAAKPKRNLGPSKLNPDLNRRLMAYVAVASGAGVATLALAQPAAAEIIYTPANISVGNSYAIDLNRDGIPDFTLQITPVDSGHGHDLSLVLNVPGNAALIGPLAIGSAIGAKRKFDSSVGSYGGIPFDENFEYGSIHSSGGPWFNVTNKFMGFKFLIGSEIHYGWARLKVQGALTTTVTGYAYETVANRSLRAGQRSESEVETSSISPLDLPALNSLSLGLLASGAQGRDVWRRELENPAQNQ